MDRAQIRKGRAQDEAEKLAYYKHAKRAWHRRLWDLVKSVLR
jgi:hypothetical protein